MTEAERQAFLNKTFQAALDLWSRALNENGAQQIIPDPALAVAYVTAAVALVENAPLILLGDPSEEVKNAPTDS